MKIVNRLLVCVIMACFCAPVLAVSSAAEPAKASGGKTSVKPKEGRDAESKREPKEKKEVRHEKKDRPSDPPPYKEKRPSDKPPLQGYKEKQPRDKRPDTRPDHGGCPPDYGDDPDWDPIWPDPPEVIVEYYLETGYYGESDFNLDEAGVWMSSISIIASAIALGGGGNLGAASFGISSGSIGLLFSTSDDDTYRKANFVAGAAALVLGLLNSK